MAGQGRFAEEFLSDNCCSQGSSLSGTKLATMPKSVRLSTSGPTAESHDDRVQKGTRYEMLINEEEHEVGEID
jgi:hypothetical protein